STTLADVSAVSPSSEPHATIISCSKLPHWKSRKMSHIERVAGVLPWIVCGICVLLGFFLFLIPWCFCCLPFCVDQCLDVVHSCPACKRNLGRFNRV
ncbi:unnamed protein product, partial [Angiostrongylus costaricensis]|uniref:LITAF domain-containing protein n=1 Tax=Angiostrongylus costaricensis TaxID=334426 RepID=A0A0R3Q0Q1_ANGCS